MYSFRIGPARAFIGGRSYDGGEAGTLQAGMTTYRGEGAQQTYQTTYVEFGGRSDHLTDAIASAQGRPTVQRYVVKADDVRNDREYVGSNERNGIDNVITASSDDQVVEVADGVYQAVPSVA